MRPQKKNRKHTNSHTKLIACASCSAILELWYGWLQDAAPAQLTFVHEYCRRPFPDLKLAAVQLAAAVCSLRWGRAALARTAGLAELLLDRHGDFAPAVQQAKFALIQRLAEAVHEDAGLSFDRGLVERLEEYVAQGAFYVEAVHDVAVERQGGE